MTKSKNLVSLILLGLFLITLPGKIKAADFERDGIWYNSLGDDTVEVVANEMQPYMGEIDIPDKILYHFDVENQKEYYYKVVAIGENAFENCEYLRKITIGENVKIIKENAFAGCRNLQFVEFPEGLTEIQNYAFNSCGRLSEINFGNSLKRIGAYAFEYCNEIKTLDLPDSVQSIGVRTFGNCEGMEYLKLSNGLTKIPEYAFYYPLSLKELIIPNTVVEIGEMAFADCCKLESLILSDKLEKLGSFAFWFCEVLKSINIPNSLKKIDDRAFEGCYSLENLTIGNSIQEIGYLAFRRCQSLKSLTIPNSVRIIGESSFAECNSLESLEFGNSLISIGGGAFSGASSLKSLKFPDSLFEIQGYAFNGAVSLETIEWGNSLDIIGERAFEGAASLSVVNFPESLTSIYTDAFRNCSSLSMIEFGKNVKHIYQGSFFNCPVLHYVTCYAPNPPKIEMGDAFEPATYEKGSLFVESDALFAYRNADYWKQFNQIKPITQTDITDIVIENLPEEPLRWNQTYKLEYSFLPADVEPESVSWVALTPEIATIDENGTMIGVGIGMAKFRCFLTDHPEIKSDFDIIIDPILAIENLPPYFLVGEQVQLNAVMYPEPMYFNEVEWTSGDPNIISFDENGIAYINGLGKTTITARSIEYPNVSASAEIQVLQQPVGIGLEYRPDFIYVGKSYQFKAIITPENSDFKEVEWSSEDPEILNIDESGLATGIKAGGTMITVRIKDYPQMAMSFGINVLQPPSQIIVEDIQDGYMRMMLDDKAFLNIKVLPENTYFTDNDIVWESSNPEIVTVTPVANFGTYVELNSHSKGKAIINVYFKELPDVKASFEVEVYVGAREIVIENIPEDPIVIGETWQLSAAVLPEDATVTIIWASSNPEVATVSEDGLVTAISEGNVVINASSGAVSATCVIYVTTPFIDAEQIILNINQADLYIGETVQLEALVLPEDTTETLIWASSNPDVATVSEDGLVTAVSEGYVYIYASCGTVTAICEINVLTPVVDAEQIILNLNQADLYIGETVQLEALVLPEDTTDKTVIWGSSNPDVATVYDNGLVIAVSEGSAIIYAFCGEVTATCEINVKTPIVEADQIILNIGSGVIYIGETIQLEATVRPDDTTDKTVIWSSSNPEVATVSETGFVTAVSEGYVIITASCGPVSDTCEINVLTPIVEAEQIILNINQTDLYLGETIQLDAVVYPVDTTDKTVTWTSSNSNIASVSQDGLVTAILEGYAIITASCGAVNAICEITVVRQIIEAESIVLNADRVELYNGETFQLTAEVYPEDTTDKTVVWSSSNDKIITVSEDGLVTAVSEGTGIVVAVCGTKVATCEIIVLGDAGIEGILADPDNKISIYSTEGFLIRKDCKVEELKSLIKGIYIITSGKHRYKISI